MRPVPVREVFLFSRVVRFLDYRQTSLIPSVVYVSAACPGALFIYFLTNEAHCGKKKKKEDQ